MAFNKTHDTFATCGSDGTWVIWNKDTKSRYKSSAKSPMPVTAAAFSKDAQILIHAHGEDWNQGADIAGQR
jgi:mRNA export factor